MPGAERETPTLPSNRGTSPNVPRKCNITFDAIVTTKDKTTFVFSGESLWEIGESGAGEEKNIWEVFSQLEPNIDAAYTRQYGQTFFFKGSRLVTFVGLEFHGTLDFFKRTFALSRMQV